MNPVIIIAHGKSTTKVVAGWPCDESLTSWTIPIRVRTDMVNLVSATLHLYRQVLYATGRSLTRSWMTMIALTVFAVLFVGASKIAAPLGIAGGFILGIV